MLFKEDRAIYLQISDYICEGILGDKWKDGDRIPSVRDMAVSLEVNPNTVNRTYTHLESKCVIQNKRGIGYFVSEGAKDSIKKFLKEDFVNNEIPLLIKKIKLLDIGFNELIGLINDRYPPR
jgi:GntR family transcriptional regulator